MAQNFYNKTTNTVTPIDDSNVEGLKAVKSAGYQQLNDNQYNEFQKTGAIKSLEPGTTTGTGLTDSTDANASAAKSIAQATAGNPGGNNSLGVGANTSTSNGVTTNAQGVINPSTSSTNTGSAIPTSPSAPVSPYKAAFDATKASGVATPTDAGAARSMVQSSLPAQGPDTTAIDSFFQEDKDFGNLSKTLQDYFNPKTQETTLKDEYDNLTKEAGLDGLDTQLMNSKNIIDGTEDDIRREIQAAGGFATDSQIQALSLARNKTLIKNYNNLLNTKQLAEDKINTLLGLEQKDRAAASDKLDKQLNISFKIADMQQKMADNARSGLETLTKQVGFDGLYAMTAGNPYDLAVVERTLGLPAGGLAIASAQAAKDRANELAKDNLDLSLKEGQLDIQKSNLQTDVLQRQAIQSNLATDKLQRANIQSQINERDINANSTVGGVPEKVMTKIQSSPEYKTINGVLPAIQALSAYKNAVTKYGTAEKLSGSGKGELAGTYGNALATWKTLAGLGALSGADFTLAENAVPPTGFFQRSSVMKGKLDSSIDNAIAQAESLTKRLQQNYPQASENLQRQLDDAKVIAYPDKFKVGPDGQVYEITKK